MNAYTPSLTSRITTAFSALVILAVLGGALLYLNVGLSLPWNEAGNGEGPVEIRDARDLPMQAPVRSSAELEAWARTAGQTLLSQMGPLSPHDEVMLGRFLAIQPLVFQEAERVGLDPLWFFQVLASESAFDPLTQGLEMGDRGLGQVSFESEQTASTWASDPANPYYVPGFSPDGSIWDPRRNLVLSAIVLRSLYAMPDVKTHEQAYARYTHGLEAVKDSRISEETMPRVERAKGYQDTLEIFLALAYADPDSSMAVLSAGLVREQLRVAANHEPGRERYRALRDLYLAPRDVTYAASPWRLVLYMGDVLTFARLSEHLTGEDIRPDLEQIDSALRERLPSIESDGDAALQAVARSLLNATEMALTAGVRDNEIGRFDERFRRDMTSEVRQ